MTEKTQTASLLALWAAWEVEMIAQLSSATCKRYRGVFHGFTDWVASVERRQPVLADLHPITLVGYRSWLQESRTASTTNTHLSALRTWCDWLVEGQHLDINPAARLKLVRQQAKPAPAALHPKQVNALLRAAQQTRYPARNTAILQMLLQTGLRIGECAALRWGDIALGERKGMVSVRAGKGNQARRVPLNQSIRQALADYVAPILGVGNSLNAVALVWQQQSLTTPLWRSERGAQLSGREMSRMIHQLVQTCAVRDLVPAETTPHSLRHTFSSRYLVRHPGDLVGLAWLLGHSSVRTTQTYVQPTEEEMAERVSQIDLNAYAG
jgi:site-specific recombinase XerD